MYLFPGDLVEKAPVLMTSTQQFCIAKTRMVSPGAEADAMLTGNLEDGLDHAEEVNDQSYLTLVTLSTCFFH